MIILNRVFFCIFLDTFSLVFSANINTYSVDQEIPEHLKPNLKAKNVFFFN